MPDYPPPSSITPGNLTVTAARALLHKYQPLNEKALGVAQPASAEVGDFPFQHGFSFPAMRLPVTLFNYLVFKMPESTNISQNV